MASTTAAKLRACLRCHYAQTTREFYMKGCPNCQDTLEENIGAFTTSNYDGLICMLQPEQSWVAKWQRIVKVVGHLPERDE